jgi:hypothetical protein
MCNARAQVEIRNRGRNVAARRKQRVGAVEALNCVNEALRLGQHELSVQYPDPEREGWLTPVRPAEWRGVSEVALDA